MSTTSHRQVTIIDLLTITQTCAKTSSADYLPQPRL